MPTIVCSAERSAILRAVDELPLPALGDLSPRPALALVLGTPADR